jgi:hypothetical protein
MTTNEVQCPFCGVKYIPVLTRKHTELPIQQEFPHATSWQREQLITGMCKKCFDKTFNSKNRSKSKSKPKTKKCRCN